jgi:hypothetical protein
MANSSAEVDEPVRIQGNCRIDPSVLGELEEDQG